MNEKVTENIWLPIELNPGSAAMSHEKNVGNKRQESQK